MSRGAGPDDPGHIKTLTFETGGTFVAQQAWGFLTREAVALACQFTSRLLPMVMPLVVWLAGHGSYLAQLSPGLRPQRRWAEPPRRSGGQPRKRGGVARRVKRRR